MKKIIVNYASREKRYALIEKDKVEKLYIKQPKQTSAVGNIYWGTVEKVLPGMSAAFIDIGEHKSGYIHLNKLTTFVLSEEEKEQKERKSISSFVHQGEKMLVQIEKDATGTKGPRLSAILELPGEHIIYMPKGRYVAVSKKIEDYQIKEKWRQFGYQIKSEEEGLIFRTSSQHATEESIQAELQRLREEYEKLKKLASGAKKPQKLIEQDPFIEELLEEIRQAAGDIEMVADDRSITERIKSHNTAVPIHLYTGKESIFSSYHLEVEIEKALKRVVWLQNGAYIVIDETEALTVIDVNTGKFSGKQHLADTVLKTNLLAASESARQIRLRDTAGMILIDFIDMRSTTDRNKVIELLKKELKKDNRRSEVLGYTQLGIVEITRKKTKVSISEALMERCTVCEGTGKVSSSETIAFRLERELYEYRNQDIEEAVIEISAEVKKVFCGEQNVHKKRLEEILGFKLNFEVKEGEKPFYLIRQLLS